MNAFLMDSWYRLWRKYMQGDCDELVDGVSAV